MKAIPIIIATILFASCAANRYRRPPALKEGDTIGLLNMSSRMSTKSDTASIRQKFKDMGFNVVYGNHILDQQNNSFGADDTDRANDMNRMLRSPEIKAIICYRGGYGAVRTLDYIDWRTMQRNPKWIAGYSDVTMLHLATQKHGIQSIHSDMPITFGDDSVSIASLREALMGKLKRIEVPYNSLNQQGKAEGYLIGGNMSLIYAASGTPEDKALKGKDFILFIEDVNEKLYQIDRMLQNLKRSGKLARCKAILVGHMTGIDGLDRFGVDSAQEHISSYTKQYNIPVIFSMPAGHSHPNLSMYMGSRVKVVVEKNRAFIEFK